MQLDTDIIYGAFKKHIFSYAPFSNNTWDLLEKILAIKHFKKNEYLLEEGKICRSIDFIFTGATRFYYNKDGEEITTALFLEENCITNMKSISNFSPSEIYIQALEDTVVVRLHKEDLTGLYTRSSELQALGRAILEGMIIRENEWKEMYMLFDAEKRYKFLMDKSPQIIQRIPLQYIASFLNIRRETLSRIRSRFSG